MIVPATKFKPVSKKSRAKKAATKLSALNRANSKKTKAASKSKRKPKKSPTLRQVRNKIETMRDADELLLPKLFSDQTVQKMAQRIYPDGRQRTYTVPKTLGLFIQQVLSKDRGCQEVVHRFNKQRKSDQLSPVSTNTTSYCAARHRIPIALIMNLTRQTAQLAESKVPSDWLWQNRRAVLLDGLVVDAPDTPENQEVYPQPSSQKPGLGFPQIRQTAAISLATGVVLRVEYGPVEGKKTGEATQFRKMQATFKEGDIIVADSNFECYRDLATMKEMGVDMVCNKNGSRKSPFQGECQEIEDVIQRLYKPAYDKSRFTKKRWEALADFLDVRIIRYQVGGRNKEITIVTTLLDQKIYTAKEIAQLYGYRWHCELDIRSIKTVMGMAHLSCHTPEMLERELLVYYLACNLIRIAIMDAAKIGNVMPRQIKFKSSKDAWLNLAVKSPPEAQRDSTAENEDYAWLLWSIVTSKITARPGRQEPRKIKRRNSKYELLKQSRNMEREAIAS